MDMQEQVYAQIDAMQIALHYNLKTVNGYSGNSPKRWALLEVSGERYLQNLREWARLHPEITSLYGYDLIRNQWFGPVDLGAGQLLQFSGEQAIAKEKSVVKSVSSP